MNKSILFLLFFVINNCVIGQYYVVDYLSKKPIEAVHISYGENKGFISNEDGYIIIPDFLEIDTLLFSHISYRSKKIPVESLSDTIFLKESEKILEEIVVKSFNARDTIAKAVSMIENNYLSTPHNSHGFYRQSLQEDSMGVELIEIDFISFLKNHRSSYKAEIIDGQKTKNYSKLGLITHGGIVQLLNETDLIKRNYLFLGTQDIDDYLFSYEGTIEYGSFDVYKVCFKPYYDNSLDFYHNGELYIDTKSLAIVEFRISVDKKKIDRKNMLINKKYKRQSKKKAVYIIKDIKVQLKYQLLPNKKWALFFVKLENKRQGVFRDQSHIYDLSSSMVINDVVTDDVNENVDENYSVYKDLSKELDKIKSITSWGNNYNISLSENDQRILNDIFKKELDNKYK